MSRPTITTRPLEVTETGHYTELLYDDGENDDRLWCAAHGGFVEPGTAEIALELATGSASASCWACLGYDDDGDEFDLWHPPSSGFAPETHPLLERIADRGFETVVSLHGLAADEVVVGGGVDEETKLAVQTELAGAVSVPVRTASGGPYGGVNPQNFVNWLARDGTGGIQLELGPTARTSDVDAVRSALETWLE